jgi:hypothetical protein
MDNEGKLDRIPLTEAEQKWRDSTQGVFNGYDVAGWPEFQAFLRRLGVPLERDFKAVTIRVAIDEHPRIIFDMAPREPKPGPIETTVVHNEDWRTFEPPVELTDARP